MISLENISSRSVVGIIKHENLEIVCLNAASLAPRNTNKIVHVVMLIPVSKGDLKTKILRVHLKSSLRG